MSDNLRDEIYRNLKLKETDDLLEIWREGDPEEWDEGVFEIIRDILQERLGQLPAPSVRREVKRHLENVQRYVQEGNLEQALQECLLAIELKPDHAVAYNARGEIYDELGQLEDAMRDYRQALELDPLLEAALENLEIVEQELDEAFLVSTTKRQLDQALEYFYDEQPEKAADECEQARQNLPQLATAYNYLGLIYQEMGQLEPAIQAYRQAMQLNPGFSAARDNLANATLSQKSEQFRKVAAMATRADEEADEPEPLLDETLLPELSSDDSLLPEWLYLDEKAYLLRGWPGHRTRQGRSGYDPLDSDFENAHMEGVMLRRLITGTLRTRNPVYLFFMTVVGLIFCLPLLLGALGFLHGETGPVFIAILDLPHWAVGIAVFVNVSSSLLPTDEADVEAMLDAEENGSAFF